MQKILEATDLRVKPSRIRKNKRWDNDNKQIFVSTNSGQNRRPLAWENLEQSHSERTGDSHQQPHRHLAPMMMGTSNEESSSHKAGSDEFVQRWRIVPFGKEKPTKLVFVVGLQSQDSREIKTSEISAKETRRWKL